jgi:hypothetical protein
MARYCRGDWELHEGVRAWGKALDLKDLSEPQIAVRSRSDAAYQAIGGGDRELGDGLRDDARRLAKREDRGGDTREFCCSRAKS